MLSCRVVLRIPFSMVLAGEPGITIAPLWQISAVAVLAPEKNKTPAAANVAGAGERRQDTERAPNTVVAKVGI